MNVLKLMKIGKILSIVGVIFIPIIWMGLNYFDLLLVKFLGHTLYTWVYIIAWYSVIFTMMIRPLSDLLPQYKSLKQLCLLRRAFGIISAMIICTLLIDRWISNPSSLMSFFTLSEWGFTSWPSFTGFFSLPEWDGTEALMAKLSDVTALILLVTSNNFSQKLLKKNWKRVQRLSYVYLIAGGIVALRYGDDYFIQATLILVIVLFILAEIKKSKLGNFFKKTHQE